MSRRDAKLCTAALLVALAILAVVLIWNAAHPNPCHSNEMGTWCTYQKVK